MEAVNGKEGLSKAVGENIIEDYPNININSYRAVSSHDEEHEGEAYDDLAEEK